MTCPIPHTHKKLLEIHRLWHQSYDNYFDAEGFRTNLNATIQALRNLTFALQNEKKAISEFDDWYSEWQQKMKDDEILSWLNNARVKIVHQKDLETKSMVEVTIKNYQNVAEFNLELHPIITSKQIGLECVNILSEKYPLSTIKECFAVVERKWTEENLPNWELLDALAYGYYFLSRMVNEAHEKSEKNSTCSIRDCLHKLSDEEISTGKYNCMSGEQDFKTETITLNDFETVTFGYKKIETLRDAPKKVLKRYKIKDFARNKEILEYAKQINEMAKRVLVKDKHHRQMFMLHSSTRGWEIVDAEVQNKTSKFMLMSQLAKRVKENNVEAVIHISEAWMTQYNVNEKASANETTNKKEALSITVVGKNIPGKNYTTYFRRGLTGRIILNETTESENVQGFNFLQPIISIWNS